MANHRPQRKSGWQTQGGSLPTLTFRYTPRSVSWWLDVPRDQWGAKVQAEARSIASGRYGIQTNADLREGFE